MAILLHGTTLHRAELILTNGPNLDYIESGGSIPSDEFSTLLEDARTDVVGAVVEYAIKKAKNFPDERGPAVLVIDVPDEIVDLTFDEYLPRSQGLAQFDRGGEALRLLQETWHDLPKHIR